jgi:spore coat protein U-like protein
VKLSNAAKPILSAAVLIFLAHGTTPTPVEAATTTTTFAVTATVVATCLVSATALGFGNYTGVVNPASSTLSVTCTNTTTYNVGLSAGTATGATASTRSMIGPASALLGYGLFRDAGHTLNWGVTIGTETQTGTGNRTAQAITVFGQIPAGEFVAPGAYADTITATFTF